MDTAKYDGKFTEDDLNTLRSELMQAGLDSWQAAELIASFLTARGYGVSTGDARTVATVIESQSCSLECMQRELEQVARVM